MTNTDRERIIREAIAARQAEGWTIVSWNTYLPLEKKCCPLGAFGSGDTAINGSHYLDAGHAWVSGFTGAVDGLPCYPIYDPEAYALGLKFKEEFGL